MSVFIHSFQFISIGQFIDLFKLYYYFRFARTCHLGPRNEPICDCEEGYVGDRCERCAERFQGNPYRTGCVPLIVKRCDPTGTLYEDPVTGLCRCKVLH